MSYPYIRKKISLFTLNYSIEHCIGVSRQCKWNMKRMASKLESKKGKLSLFIDIMNVFVENLNKSTKKLLELTSKCSKVARHKIQST